MRYKRLGNSSLRVSELRLVTMTRRNSALLSFTLINYDS
jgi:aryl-alcohol dehydrogenase-like predicted oxidoreductase